MPFRICVSPNSYVYVLISKTLIIASLPLTLSSTPISLVISCITRIREIAFAFDREPNMHRVENIGIRIEYSVLGVLVLVSVAAKSTISWISNKLSKPAF
jgi:hypothetical protein